MSWKPEVKTGNDQKWYDNNLAFATKEEAEASAADLAYRWMLVTAHRAAESEQPVNAQLNLQSGVLTLLPKEEVVVDATDT